MAHIVDNYKVSDKEGDTKMFSASKSYAKQFIGLNNPVVQDVYLTCDSLGLYRMFPKINNE
jgi:hypothetical protein